MADRPLDGLKAFSTTIATDINDLPATSPHASYSEHDARNLGFASDQNTTRGTAASQSENAAISHTIVLDSLPLSRKMVVAISI
jgi:hypothetical protein